MNKLSILVAGLAFTATSGFAATVDFENEVGVGANDQVDVTTATGSYFNGGITFTSGDANPLFLVGSGGSIDGFVPSDRVTPAGAFGDVFLTGDFVANSAMNLSFSAAKSISFDIADIDGTNGKREQFTFKFLYQGSEVGSVFRQAGDANTTPGDGTITNITFAGLFDSVEITNRTVGSPDGSNRPNIGWGIDNIEVAPVPVPAAGLMLITALGGMAAMRRRKKSS